MERPGARQGVGWQKKDKKRSLPEGGSGAADEDVENAEEPGSGDPVKKKAKAKAKTKAKAKAKGRSKPKRRRGQDDDLDSEEPASEGEDEEGEDGSDASCWE